MRKTILIAAVVAVLLAPAAFGQSSDSYYGGSYSRMSFIKGEAFVQHGQDAGFEQGEVNLVLLEGDKIGTKSGRLEVQFGRRNYLRLGDFSQADIVTLPRSDGDGIKIHLLAGRAFVRIGTLAAEKRFEIHTPDASFYVLEAGLYRIEVRENRETEFAVFDGSAEAAAEEGSVVVNRREQVTAANGRLVSSPGALMARNDEFGEWNASRDAVYAKKVDRTYLPADYYDYEVELAENGRWTNDAEYGDVWVPRTSYSDWRPYYYGHWSWYPIIGWTWVSNDSWGWCTSHYGRWGWGLNLGWYWIPERHSGWGPAWVNWYWERDYIGWCPLSYWGYPAYVLNNRFYGRNNSRYYPNGSLGLSMVHRDQLQNRRLSGALLDRAGMNRLGNIQLRNAQPNLRPNLGANGDVAGRARQALSRDGLRPVSQGFSSGRRDSSNALRSVSRSGAGSADAASVRRSGAGASAGSNPVREIRSSGGATTRSLSRNDGAASGQAERRAVERGTYLPPAGGDSSASRIRSFPSREGNAGASSGRSLERVAPTPRESGASSGRVISSPSRESGAVSRSGGSGSAAPSRVRESVSRDTARSFPSRSNGGEAGSPSTSSSRSTGSSSSINRSTSRSVSTPSRSSSSSYSAPSRSAGSSYSAPSRSSSAPSRSSGSSYSAPSRSAGSSSRSYSAPSRSSGSSSGSYSSPSRSSSAPSRGSYSAPSRSSGASSGSNGSMSRSSGSSRSSSSGGGSSSSRSSGSSSGGRVRR